MNFNIESFGGSLTGLTVSLFILPWILIHIWFAVGVLEDANRLKQTKIVGPLMWAFATLFGGIFVATAY